MTEKRACATTILVMVGLLFLLTYPFREVAIWGFVMHVAGAAFIGGLADWYGVTALFRKPFGVIGWKTAVIPRKREALLAIARQMLREEFFTQKNWYEGIKQQEPLRQILSYLQTPQGHALVQQARIEVWEPLLQAAPWRQLPEILATSAYTRLAEIPWAMYIAQSLDRLAKPDMAQPLWNVVRERLVAIILSERITVYGTHMLRRAFSSYAERSVVRDILFAMTQDDTSIRRMVLAGQRSIAQWLTTQTSVEDSAGRYFLQAIQYMATQLRTNVVWQQGVQRWVTKQVASYGMAEQLQRWIPDALSELAGADWEVYFFREMDTLAKDTERVAQWERQLLLAVAGWRQALQRGTERMAMAYLETYSGEAMAHIFEKKMGPDLQMIRMNGTLVGGVLGGVCYLLQQGLEALLGGGV